MGGLEAQSIRGEVIDRQRGIAGPGNGGRARANTAALVGQMLDV
jgi:hypothetical protein